MSFKNIVIITILSINEQKEITGKINNERNSNPKNGSLIDRFGNTFLHYFKEKVNNKSYENNVLNCKGNKRHGRFLGADKI